MTDYTPNSSSKQCTKCKEIKPLTTEYFGIDRSTPTGFSTQCKVCRKAYSDKNSDKTNARARKAWAANSDELNARKKEQRSGKRTEINKRAQKWKAENRDKLKAQGKQYYAKKRDEISKKAEAKRIEKHDDFLAKEKAYRIANQETVRERARRWYQKHKAEVSERLKSKRQNDPDRYKKESVVKERARQSRKTGLPSSFSAQDWQKCIDYFGGNCAVCGRQPGLFHTLAMDHWIPITSPECPGHIAENIIPLCHGLGGCNNSKSNRDALEWLIWKFGKRKGNQIAKNIQMYFGNISMRSE